jgi:hypothetical protein
MSRSPSQPVATVVIAFFIAALLAGPSAPHAAAQSISFSSTGLQNASLGNPTSLEFGPDGRLYVSQQNGTIKAFTVQRNGAQSYEATDTETIGLVQAIPNHDDDGSSAGQNTRQVTGLLVAGTSANPILYVTSSDPRIGGGGGGSDTGLDTNSGILSRLTCTGGMTNGSCAQWEDVVDADLTTDPTVSIPDPVGAVEVRVSEAPPPVVTAQLTLGDGFNLISIPIQREDMTWGAVKTIAFGADNTSGAAIEDHCDAPFTYDPGSGYSSISDGDALVAGRGYVMPCSGLGTPTAVGLSGQEAAAKTVRVEAGWNVVGLFAQAIQPENVAPVPAGLELLCG